MDYRRMALSKEGVFGCRSSQLSSSRCGGLRPGLLATALSFLAFEYYFTAPGYSFVVDIKELPRLLIFAPSALLSGC